MLITLPGYSILHSFNLTSDKTYAIITIINESEVLIMKNKTVYLWQAAPITDRIEI